MLRPKIKHLFILLGILLAAASFSQLSKRYVVPILMYHQVAENPEKRSDIVTLENFAKQMEFIKKRGYQVITMDELLDAHASKKKLNRNQVVITFDDGYKDNFTNAFSVLKQYGFSAIIFIIPELVGQEGYLSWDDIKEMEKSRIVFGSHTLSHPYLPDQPPAEQKRQIFLSKKFIEKNLNHPIHYFCYPSGGFSDQIKVMVKEAGYRAAVTTNRGFVRFNKDLYEIKRIKFNDNTTTDFGMWAKLSGYYNIFRNSKKPN